MFLFGNKRWKASWYYFVTNHYNFHYMSNITDTFKGSKKKYYLRLKKPRMLHSSADPKDHESTQATHKWLKKLQETFLLEVTLPKRKCRRSVYAQFAIFIIILFVKFLIFRLRKPKALAPVTSQATLCWFPHGWVLETPESRRALTLH